LLEDPGVAYVSRREDLAAAVTARRQGPLWPLVQRYVPGHGLGVSALCDRGRVLAWFAHERLRDIRPSGSGSSLRRSVPVDPRLREAAARMLADLAWHGPAMFEFRHDEDDPGGPWLIEVNGRFWGSLQLAIAAGVDLPRQWVGILTGAPQRSTAAYWPGVTLRWLWGDARRLMHVVKGPPPGYPGDYPGVWRGMWELVGPQPAGTHSETWDATDRWPVVAEWVQGIGELLGQPRGRLQ
jgi:predicted ATP-grasp superfamily ATP-dependent carboligase